MFAPSRPAQPTDGAWFGMLDFPTSRSSCGDPGDPTMSDEREISVMLGLARAGDAAAVGEVFALVYEELRRIARAQLRRVRGIDTLNTTAIVHEAYLKLVRSPGMSYEDRVHFYSVAAKAMRQILLNHARDRLAQKRGAGAVHFPLDEVDAPIEARAGELIELDQALDRLALLEERLARVVELRFFAGLSVPETAKALGVGEATVKRDWAAARAFLHREMHAGDDA